jgi:dihydroorotase
MFDTLLRGGRVVDADGIEQLDIAIRSGRIAARIAPGNPAQAARVVDVEGKLLLPGLIDAHVHLREPGMTWKEDFASGTRAGARRRGDDRARHAHRRSLDDLSV